MKVIDVETETIQTGRYTSAEESGRSRLMAILKDNSKPNGWMNQNFSTEYLAKLVGLNEHEVVHLLHGMSKDNLVTFKEGKRNKAPVRLRLTPVALGKEYAKFSAGWYKDHPITRKTRLGRKNLASNGTTLGDLIRLKEEANRPEPMPEPITVELETIGPEFPLIEALVRRRERLQEASKLAEQAGAEDLAIQLQETADKPHTPLENEAIRLFAKVKWG